LVHAFYCAERVVGHQQDVHLVGALDGLIAVAGGTEDGDLFMRSPYPRTLQVNSIGSFEHIGEVPKMIRCLFRAVTMAKSSTMASSLGSSNGPGLRQGSEILAPELSLSSGLALGEGDALML